MKRPKVRRGTLAAILAAGTLVLGVQFCSSEQNEEKLREGREMSDVIKFDNVNFKLKEIYANDEELMRRKMFSPEQIVEGRRPNRFYGEVPKQDLNVLWSLIEDEGNIIDKNIIKAIIYHESKGNFKTKCRGEKIQACGLMQLQPEVIVSGLRKLYGSNEKLDDFKQRYGQQLDRKKMAVNSYNNNYFMLLEDLERKIGERRKNLNKLGDKEELKKIKTLERTIIEGYYVTKPMMVRNNSAYLERLCKNKHFKDYVVTLTGKDVNWEDILQRQHREVKKMIRLVHDNHNPDINVGFGDLYVASLWNEFGSLPRGLGFYSGGYRNIGSKRYYNLLTELGKKQLFSKHKHERIY
ncbi:hypothetical protein HYX11_04690 [Candidatus Woesearchaeota archaeon]|nr:hypothetical protein [Candidatus Woesearchaeota archaeon]